MKERVSGYREKDAFSRGKGGCSALRWAGEGWQEQKHAFLPGLAQCLGHRAPLTAAIVKIVGGKWPSPTTSRTSPQASPTRFPTLWPAGNPPSETSDHESSYLDPVTG